MKSKFKLVLKSGKFVHCAHAYSCPRYGYVAVVGCSNASEFSGVDGVRLSPSGDGHVLYGLIDFVIVSSEAFCI